MMKLKKNGFYLLTLMMLLLLSACSKDEAKTTASAENGGVIPLKVGIQKNAALTNAWIAESVGIYEEHGLDVKLIEFKSGSESINAQRSGSVDIILSAPGTAMVANESGFDLVSIAQNEIAQAEGPDTASVQVLADSKIENLKDLEGKKVAIYDSRNQLVLGLKKIIEESGADVDKVEFVEVPFSSMGDALKNNQVDAISLVDPYTTQLVSEGTTKVISWNYVESIPEQPVGAWYARSKFVEENPEAVSRFYDAISASIEYMLADEERAKKHIVDFTGVDEKLITDMPQIAWSNEFNTDVWQQIVDMYVEAGELKQKHEATEYFSQYVTETLK
ncbi:MULTISPECIES: ABC transporter substrate-binding protein [Solibacillus]|uniref:NrtA/SsuA/CpmA family ABC transporter substrate-binding protein n=1 Tax=Solibacillus merdavium TaxID=2762218 RepID=A0ABR8XMG9_9BACL|nr:NrtA/SsuA/CpmA family ABC transporter substrate-binding protein [Solibacillus merdavium]MBD8033137.1 NrtA/SsuA/CpmA family ABC transporter substrate-binding protein [Solibacillus merdavium]